MTTHNEAAEELRRLAEETLIWQDEWDSQPSDGSAVQNFIDAASPRAVLEALAAAKAAGAREAVERIRARLPAALRDVSLVADLYDERQLDKAAAAILDLLNDDERESSLGRDTEGHLILTLGPGAESPSRKGGRADLQGLSPLEAWNEDANR